MSTFGHSKKERAERMQLADTKQINGTPIILYGGAGIGKSTLASLAPNPVFIDVENGLRRIQNTPRTPHIKTWGQFYQACDDFKKSNYRTMIVDTLDVLEQLLHQFLCKTNNWKSIESAGYGKGYNIAAEHWMRFCDYIDEVCSMGRNVILIAHEQIKSYAPPDSDAYDRYSIKINKNSANILIGKVDAVLFAQHDILTKEDKTKDDRVRGISTGRRLLRTTETAAYIAKNRFNLPPTVEFDALIFEKLLFVKDN